MRPGDVGQPATRAPMRSVVVAPGGGAVGLATRPDPPQRVVGDVGRGVLRVALRDQLAGRIVGVAPAAHARISHRRPAACRVEHRDDDRAAGVLHPGQVAVAVVAVLALAPGRPIVLALEPGPIHDVHDLLPLPALRIGDGRAQAIVLRAGPGPARGPGAGCGRHQAHAMGGTGGGIFVAHPPERIVVTDAPACTAVQAHPVGTRLGIGPACGVIEVQRVHHPALDIALAAGDLAAKTVELGHALALLAAAAAAGACHLQHRFRVLAAA